jgi:polyhydroxybutyrate depolymerase
MSGFNAVADQNGVVAVYPNGTGPLSGDRLLTWNGGSCCGYAQEKNVDDVGFVRAVVSDLRAHLNVDVKRIYAAGMSNGAILSQRLACEAADVFAAVAPVSGTLNFSPCRPSRPISVIAFHGTADQHIPYDGGYGPKSLVNVDFASVQASIAFWTAFDGCAPQPRADSFQDIRHETWTGCAGGSSVELYTIVGGGHAWPGGEGGWADSDSPTTTISASQLIWAFFASHPLSWAKRACPRPARRPLAAERDSAENMAASHSAHTATAPTRYSHDHSRPAPPRRKRLEQGESLHRLDRCRPV